MKKFKFYIDGNPFDASVNEMENNQLEVEVNGSKYMVEIDRAGTKAANVAATTRNAAPQGKITSQSSPAVKTATAPVAAATKTVRSQLPGSILKVLVEPGQIVNKGDVIMTIESMKMENNIMAETAGKIIKIYVEPGKSVMQDDKLADMEITGSEAPATPKPATAPATPKPAPQPVTKQESKPQATTPANGKPLKSPLPGSIIKIMVTEGQSVKRGDILLTMESMKMENEIRAEKDGVVTAIKVTAGQNVMQDDDLLIMA